MKNKILFFPFLVAVYPFIFTYSHNVAEVPLSSVVLLTLAMIILIFIIQLALSRLFTDQHKNGLVISLFILMFFYFGYFHDLAKGMRIGGIIVGREKAILLCCVLLFFGGIIIVLRTKRNLSGITRVLNVTAIILVLITTYNIAEFKIKKALTSEDKAGINEYVFSASTTNKTFLPDIYFIILDGYANSATLKEDYGFDNGDFESFLEKKGFRINRNSRCNYAETRLSLASTLNMEHLFNFGESLQLTTLYRMIEQNKVMKELKAKGYYTIDISSNIGKIQGIECADLNVETGSFLANEYHSVLIQMTLLGAFKDHLNLGHFYREKILNTFDELAKIQHRSEKPIFVFAHIVPPHPPYVFDSTGNPILGRINLDEWGNMWEQKDKYIDQVIFVNNKMKDVITKILSEAEREPVIIIQSDHGPQLISGDNSVNIRMKNFNAFYIPKKDGNFFYDSMTSVNTFRALFNHYFGTNLELLEDRSYYTRYKLPYHFVDVTDSLSQNYISQGN